MSQNAPLEMWLAGKRAAFPPESFVQKVMAAVEVVSESPRPAAKDIEFRHTLPPRCVGYLIATAAALVCAVRAYSLIHVLIEPTPEFSVVAGEAKEEVPDDDRDVSRS
jgi:hypothetical protein